jgi:hypothetical protein
LPLYITTLNDALARLTTAAQSHAKAAKAAEIQFVHFVDLTHRAIHRMGTQAFLDRFTSSEDSPTVVDHVNTLTES